MQRSIEKGQKGLLGPKSQWFFNMPSTSAWWAWQRKDLETQREWRGCPLFFLITSCSTMTNDLSATYLTGKAKRAGEVANICTAGDERK